MQAHSSIVPTAPPQARATMTNQQALTLNIISIFSNLASKKISPEVQQHSICTLFLPTSASDLAVHWVVVAELQ